jgi:hypothetical protein
VGDGSAGFVKLVNNIQPNSKDRDRNKKLVARNDLEVIRKNGY